MIYGIIAAGLGSRLQADGFKGFKPMVQIQGETLIARLIRVFNENDGEAIYLILNEAERELGQFLEQLPSRAPIHILYKDTPSSFHSFYELVKDLPDLEEICISTIDPVFKESTFKQYIAHFKARPELDALMAVTTFNDDDAPLHVEVTEDKRITRFASHLEVKDGQPYISGGIYCLRLPAVRLAEEAMEKQIKRMRNYQQELVIAGLRLQAFDFGKIIDIDHVADIALAEAFLVTA